MAKKVDNGHHEVWKDTTLIDAYEELFAEALKEYNVRISERHPERVKTMEEYLKSICQNNGNSKNCKKPVYECVAQIGSKDFNPGSETSQAILWDFYQQWNMINPNLRLIGCYLHDDEEGYMHIHINYIPYASSTRGMKTQPSLSKALSAMGYENKSINDTAQMQWEAKMRKKLEEICFAHGIETESTKGGKKHLETEVFKLEQKKKELQRQLNSEEYKEAEQINSLIHENQLYKSFIQDITNLLREIYHLIPNQLRIKIDNLIDKYTNKTRWDGTR